jgi:hypothetical protein
MGKNDDILKAKKKERNAKYSLVISKKLKENPEYKKAFHKKKNKIRSDSCLKNIKNDVDTLLSSVLKSTACTQLTSSRTNNSKEKNTQITEDTGKSEWTVSNLKKIIMINELSIGNLKLLQDILRQLTKQSIQIPFEAKQFFILESIIDKDCVFCPTINAAKNNIKKKCIKNINEGDLCSTSGLLSTRQSILLDCNNNENVFYKIEKTPPAYLLNLFFILKYLFKCVGQDQKDKFFPCNLTLLRSLPKGKYQGIHTDFGIDKNTKDNNPFVLPFTVHISFDSIVKLNILNNEKLEIVSIPPFSVLIAGCKVEHGGVSYNEISVRAHLYVCTGWHLEAKQNFEPSDNQALVKSIRNIEVVNF